MRVLAAFAAVATGLALGVGEAAMRPTTSERVTLYGVFAAVALLAVPFGWWLTRVHRRLPSLRWTVLAVAVAAVVSAGVVVAASARAMLLDPADMRLVLAALALGTGLGVLLAIAVTGSLTRDLRELADTAGRVAGGDLTMRTGIDRRDEVGEVAASVDRMVDQLASYERDRARGEEARRRLLASVGHDLRTPLASLRAAVEAIQDGVAAEPDRYLRAMAADVELLRSMVDDLFMLTRLEAGDMRLDRMALDLPEIAEGAVEGVAPLAARSDVTVELAAVDSVRTTGDPQAIDRVLRNLLDNAVRHSPEAGVVRVSVTAEDSQGVLTVADSGPGFTADLAERAFDMFERGDSARERSSGGAGLGLAIARELVEAHGGSIRIEPGQGATVVVRLPVTP
ncbi:Signal transduction histidine kinase [Haloechinothrix alba]|uniref:Signal transduction histidine-protein kinase/phosphatase MprB n=1 Tax=Haloechinothrix alba TaxID=664784 RepID=A0A238YUK0_9PSEU|nr:HAMP domain-containing sensor histidine kinase [Haloechinothrix alba]SNR74817.1 Signal transduction histidine kinase [Haloechinothrix alba]